MIISATNNFKIMQDKLQNKKVLILGSGPSAGEVDWQNIKYDILVTTSFFYLNHKICLKNPKHVSLSKLVDLENKDLIKHLEKNKTCTISFEPKVENYVNNVSANENKVINLIISSHKFYQNQKFLNFYKKFKNRIFFYRASGGLEGLAGRLCWPVLASNPKKIYLCGIDGISENWKNDPVNYFRSHKGTTDKHYTYKDYKESFESFGERIYNESRKLNIEMINLGKGKNYNLLTSISEKYEVI